jgi:hypothetical protein
MIFGQIPTHHFAKGQSKRASLNAAADETRFHFAYALFKTYAVASPGTDCKLEFVSYGALGLWDLKPIIQRGAHSPSSANRSTRTYSV